MLVIAKRRVAHTVCASVSSLFEEECLGVGIASLAKEVRQDGRRGLPAEYLQAPLDFLFKEGSCFWSFRYFPWAAVVASQ